MRVTIVVAGYVGLTTGAWLSELGHDVICADMDLSRIDRLNDGIALFKEDGSGELMARGIPPAGSCGFPTI